MIIPITLGISFWRSRQGPIGPDEAPRRSLGAHVLGTFPVFVAWFLLAVSLNTVGLVPQSWHPGLSILAHFMIAFTGQHAQLEIRHQITGVGDCHTGRTIDLPQDDIARQSQTAHGSMRMAR
jgi:hypothetical protein